MMMMATATTSTKTTTTTTTYFVMTIIIIIVIMALTETTVSSTTTTSFDAFISSRRPPSSVSFTSVSFSSSSPSSSPQITTETSSNRRLDVDLVDLVDHSRVDIVDDHHDYHHGQNNNIHHHHYDRRDFLDGMARRAATATATATTTAALLLLVDTPASGTTMGGRSTSTTFTAVPNVANANAAVMMDPSSNNVNTKVFESGGKDMTLQEALERFSLGLESLRFLESNWDKVVDDGGGDNIRRYLGTVGVSSGLYGISKVLKTIKDQAAAGAATTNDGIDLDVVEFSELSDELIGAINRADGSAYMSIFATFSSSSVPPAKYFHDSYVETKQAMKIMNDLARQLPPSSSSSSPSPSQQQQQQQSK